MYQIRRCRFFRGCQPALLAVLLRVAGCAGPMESAAPTAPAIVPSPAARTPAPSTAEVVETEEPTVGVAALPTDTPVPAAPTAAPSVTKTTAPLATAEETPADSETTAVEGTDEACGLVHAASVEQSSDLSPSGQALAPPLTEFNQYRMALELDQASATYTGTQTLVFTNRTEQPLEDLVFHLYPNLGQSATPDPELMNFEGGIEITCAAIDGAPVAPMLEDGAWIARLPFAAPLAPGQVANVTLRFVTSSPRNGGQGTYGAFSASDDLWTLASSYPTLAIRVGDEWDTRRPNGWSDFVNSDMALYNVRATMPDGQRLLATGEVEQNCSSGRCEATVTAGPQRDFAMVVVEGWEEARRQVGDTTVVSSFPPSLRAGGERALELAADSLARFNENFGVYPYTELDIVPITASGFAGVEYPSLLMIGDRYYAEGDGETSFLQDVVVHEVAHMWWYNVVGNDVLREPWLDEGLTSYSGEYLYTEWSGEGQRPITDSRQAQLARQGLAETPIDLAVTDYPDAGTYVGVIYGRAALFFDVLRDELGDETFFRFLREYYRRFAFRQATTEGFETLLEEVAGRQLDPFLADWLRPGSN